MDARSAAANNRHMSARLAVNPAVEDVNAAKAGRAAQVVDVPEPTTGCQRTMTKLAASMAWIRRAIRNGK